MSVSSVPLPPVAAPDPAKSASETAVGCLLVAGSAIAWSTGGALTRFLETTDNWTVVFWRSVFAGLFLLCFMLVRDGPHGTLRLFRNMGLAGVGVGICFAIASSCFIVALSYTTVANVLLLQAAVPLLAALISWVLFRERVSLATWGAIAVVIAGVAIMVSDSLDGAVSPIGDLLALLIAIAFASATVITRRKAHLRMTPAVFLGVVMAACAASVMSGSFSASVRDFGFLFALGAVNLGLGLALFVSGARLIPSALAALIGTLEPVLGPVWVWLLHNEVPTQRTIIGGGIILCALLFHLGWEYRRQRAALTRKPPA
ncbi:MULTISPECIES: DMT family transporter [unclassified Phyllobacterium]|uniref:DMT family transporter n=1 Tax=unclassified Phyllobacterium TaxID=2638441 RepID=UPI0031FE3AD7|nr:EamA family transporter [Phyllobacterium sp.]